MRTLAKIAIALGFVGAMAIGSAAPVTAHGFHIWVGHHHHHYWGPRYYDYYPGRTYSGGYSWNGCPQGYTVQGGACRPYRW